ncbi:MAG: cutinase family protein [Mycolicibacterium mageritense]|nr:MAG: cutinase family protein [Mycolicibacterium mageritense]
MTQWPPVSAPPPTYAAKTVQLCATGDPVCFPGGLSRAAHSSCKDNGMAMQAADFVVQQLAGSAPSAALVQTAGELGVN